MSLSDLFMLVPALCVNKYHGIPNLWMCNKNLYNYSLMNYLKRGKLLECTFPTIYFTIPPSDNGYSLLKNIKLYIIMNKENKEYMLCTLSQLLPLLYGMYNRWHKVLMYPYDGPKSLFYYGVCNYNFALLDYIQQQSNKKYICDSSLLLGFKYSSKELIQIAQCLGLDVEQFKTKSKLIKYIYNLL